MGLRTLAVACALGLTLAGCAFFTKPTGMISVERQSFIDTWAVVETLGRLYFADEEKKCALPGADAPRCARVGQAKTLARQLQIDLYAKIAHPEMQIDQAAVKELIGILVSLRP